MLVVIPIWDSQDSALAGTNFEAQLFLESGLRRIRVSVAVVSLALKTQAFGSELPVSFWILFTCQPALTTHSLSV